MSRPWLITGGAGFIGANLVHHLRATEPGLELVVYDALTYAGHLDSLGAALRDPRVHFVRGDVCDGPLLARTLDRYDPEVLLHLAAESHVDRSLHGPAAFVRSNVQGTFTVLEASRSRPQLRTVVVSTDEVYGSLGPTGSFTEHSPLAPSSPYSASKAAADLLALSYFHSFGLEVLVTRCSNNYGPYQLPEKLVPRMLLAALADAPLPLYGDGLYVRDWLHVEDHCRALVLAARNGRAGRVYNLGGAAERTNLEVVRALLAAVGKPESLVCFVTDRPGHDRRYAMNFERARAELGFAPARGFEQGLRDTARWYQANRAWCDAVRGDAAGPT